METSQFSPSQLCFLRNNSFCLIRAWTFILHVLMDNIITSDSLPWLWIVSYIIPRSQNTLRVSCVSNMGYSTEEYMETWEGSGLMQLFDYWRLSYVKGKSVPFAVEQENTTARGSVKCAKGKIGFFSLCCSKICVGRGGNACNSLHGKGPGLCEWWWLSFKMHAVITDAFFCVTEDNKRDLVFCSKL